MQPTSVVDKTAIIGEGTLIWNFVHVRENAKIGKGCVLAYYVYVGRRVKIGNNVKLENQATVYEGVTIEDKVFVGPHVLSQTISIQEALALIGKFCIHS